MGAYAVTIAKIAGIVTPATGSANGTRLLYEGSLVQKKMVGMAMDLSKYYSDQPPGPLTRKSMLKALPDLEEVLGSDVANTGELVELRDLLRHALQAVSPSAALVSQKRSCALRPQE